MHIILELCFMIRRRGPRLLSIFKGNIVVK